MSQVNAKLESLTLSIGKLEQMLDAERHGKLKAITQLLEDICEREAFISADANKANQALSQTHTIQLTASTLMNTLHELTANELSSLKYDDKIDAVKVHIESVVRLLLEYQYATQIYGIATLLEIRLTNGTDPNELTKFREQINKRVKQYTTDRDKAEADIKMYLDKAHALKEHKKTQRIASVLSALPISSSTSIPLANIILGSIKMVGSSLDKNLDDQEAKKAEISDCYHSGFTMLKDMTLLDSPASTIDLFINNVGQNIEYVKIGDSYFTNLPKPEIVE